MVLLSKTQGVGNIRVIAAGGFTAILAGTNGITGIGLVEIYNVQSREAALERPQMNTDQTRIGINQGDRPGHCLP